VVSYANGASIPSGGCTITVNVTAAASGVYPNTIAAAALRTTGGNNPTPASATLTVLAAPTVTKSFSVASIMLGGNAVLTINLGNTNASALTLTSALTDTLPVSMRVAAAPGIGGTCPGAVTAASGTNTVTYANGSSIPAGGCTITVNVTGILPGPLTNIIPIGALITNGGPNAIAATALLTVTVEATGIPSLSEFGLMALAGLIALFGIGGLNLRRRR
jgi:IPTL-CTERM motif